MNNNFKSNLNINMNYVINKDDNIHLQPDIQTDNKLKDTYFNLESMYIDICVSLNAAFVLNLLTDGQFKFIETLRYKKNGSVQTEF